MSPEKLPPIRPGPGVGQSRRSARGHRQRAYLEADRRRVPEPAEVHDFYEQPGRQRPASPGARAQNRTVAGWPGSAVKPCDHGPTRLQVSTGETSWASPRTAERVRLVTVSSRAASPPGTITRGPGARVTSTSVALGARGGGNHLPARGWPWCYERLGHNRRGGARATGLPSPRPLQPGRRCRSPGRR